MDCLSANFSRLRFSRQLASKLLPTAFLASLALFASPAARAQNSGQQNACISATNASNGVTFENSCSFRVHIYWVFNDKPSIAYNNYIEPGGSHETLHKGSVDYYTCASDYFVVDTWGNVITHQVSGYGCRKK